LFFLFPRPPLISYSPFLPLTMVSFSLQGQTRRSACDHAARGEHLQSHP
jgi:hypothetical protein